MAESFERGSTGVDLFHENLNYDPLPPTEAEKVSQLVTKLQSQQKAGPLSASDGAQLTALRAGLGLEGGQLAAKEASKTITKPEQAQLDALRAGFGPEGSALVFKETAYKEAGKPLPGPERAELTALRAGLGIAGSELIYKEAVKNINKIEQKNLDLMRRQFDARPTTSPLDAAFRKK